MGGFFISIKFQFLAKMPKYGIFDSDPRKMKKFETKSLESELELEFRFQRALNDYEGTFCRHNIPILLIFGQNAQT